MISIPEFAIKEETCGYCNKPITGRDVWSGHPACIKNARERKAVLMAQQGLVSSKIDEKEEFLKAHPDGPVVRRDGLTYNQRLAKEAAYQEELELEKMRDRLGRKMQLDLLEKRVAALRQTVARDEEEVKKNDEAAKRSEQTI